LTAVGTVLGRARFPASRQAGFGILPPAPETRRVEFPGEIEEQDGKEKQQEVVEIGQLADHGLCRYTVGDFGD
jgi:hypothetical protein